MSSTWIDFRALRERVNMLDVLRHYGVAMKSKGDQATGLCPLPCHPDRTDGKRRTPSFSVNTTRGCFKCFGCQAHGNVIDYVCYSEGLDPANPQDVRQAAVKLAEWFDLPANSSADRRAQKAARPRCANTTASGVDRAEGGAAQPSKKQKQSIQPLESNQEESAAAIINPPLGFTLQHLDASHPYLTGRGFTPETIKHFGLGFCSRGMLKDRIAIPLHDATGNLIGYAGRIVDDAVVGEDCPKYLFPGRRQKGEQTIDFRKSRFLYNGHRTGEPVDALIVCEGFAGTWWLHQAGYANVVATMGADCSPEQATLIVDGVTLNGHVWVFTDADAAGDAFAVSLMRQVGDHRFVRRVPIDRGQPTDYAAAELAALLWPCS